MCTPMRLVGTACGDSYRHPPRRMPPLSGKEALYTLMLQCKIRFFDKLKQPEGCFFAYQLYSTVS